MVSPRENKEVKTGHLPSISDHMTGMCSARIAYAQRTHSRHMIGCCLIPLGSVQRWSRSKTKVVFYWDQPFQPQPVSVEAVEVSQ